MTVIERIEAAAKRLEKAKDIVRAGKVHRIEGAGGYWVVEGSQGAFYLVNGTCTCPDYRKRSKTIKFCKHMLAVEIVKSQGRRNGNAQRNGAGANRTAQQAQ